MLDRVALKKAICITTTKRTSQDPATMLNDG
jgi:hypothetical protein